MLSRIYADSTCLIAFLPIFCPYNIVLLFLTTKVTSVFTERTKISHFYRIVGTGTITHGIKGDC